MSSIPQNTALFHSVISAGLSDPDIKQAVLNYLKAETERVRPKEEWREVWFQVSADTRVYVQPGIDPRTGLLNKRTDVKLRVSVYYIARLNTAKIFGEIVHPNEMYYSSPFEGYYTNTQKFRWERSVDAPDYVVAVVAGQNAWAEVYDWFVEQTEAVSDE
jgi:hypothetical protein